MHTQRLSILVIFSVVEILNDKISSVCFAQRSLHGSHWLAGHDNSFKGNSWLLYEEGQILFAPPWQGLDMAKMHLCASGSFRDTFYRNEPMLSLVQYQDFCIMPFEMFIGRSWASIACRYIDKVTHALRKPFFPFHLCQDLSFYNHCLRVMLGKP